MTDWCIGVVTYRNENTIHCQPIANTNNIHCGCAVTGWHETDPTGSQCPFIPPAPLTDSVTLLSYWPPCPGRQPWWRCLPSHCWWWTYWGWACGGSGTGSGSAPSHWLWCHHLSRWLSLASPTCLPTEKRNSQQQLEENTVNPSVKETPPTGKDRARISHTNTKDDLTYVPHSHTPIWKQYKFKYI